MINIGKKNKKGILKSVLKKLLSFGLSRISQLQELLVFFRVLYGLKDLQLLIGNVLYICHIGMNHFSGHKFKSMSLFLDVF